MTARRAIGHSIKPQIYLLAIRPRKIPCPSEEIGQGIMLGVSSGAALRCSNYWLTVTFPQAIGAASMKLLRFVPRVTMTYQAVLGGDVTGLITVVLDALPELSPV